MAAVYCMQTVVFTVLRFVQGDKDAAVYYMQTVVFSVL